jgi:hypothetical protein
MAYTKKNKLMRILDVQEYFKKHYHQGMVIEYVYDKHIYPTFKISRTTFYKWLKIDAKNQLKELENENKGALKQISMDDIIGFAAKSNGHLPS